MKNVIKTIYWIKILSKYEVDKKHDLHITKFLVAMSIQDASNALD